MDLSVFEDMLFSPDDAETYIPAHDARDDSFSRAAVTAMNEIDSMTHQQSASACLIAQTISAHGDAPQSKVSSARPSQEGERSQILSMIEDVFDQVADALLDDHKTICISLDSRTSTSLTPSERRGRGLSRKRKLCFPGNTAIEAWRFTVLICILELVHDALTTNTIISKRDIYYRHPALFVKQAVVDKYIDDIAFTFGISRAMLNVSAAAKGLVAGTCSIVRHDGNVVNVAAEAQGFLIPNATDIESIDISNVKWIVVVEKEASFRSIVSSSAWQRMSFHTVVITAKGYPDLSTRSFLRQMIDTASNPAPAIHFFVDYDPDGLSIMSTYAFGSKSLAHESAALCLPVDKLHYLGVKSGQFLRETVHDHMHEGSASTSSAEKVLRMSGRDRQKARSLLAKSAYCPTPELDQNDLQREGTRELQVMLYLNVKAEMQVLEERDGGMAEWVHADLQRQDAARAENGSDVHAREALTHIS